ncbi:MAG: hypothetical protein EXS39_05020 [Opitutaceae bacterium]|nr:hypothetical protein [Opitutaceae bacterium]
MELQNFVAKIHVEGPLQIDPAKVVDVFHQWVAKQTVPGVLLVDVAELLHVPKGPGVIAVGHEADYALDHTGNIWGVLYRRKTPLAGSNGDRIAQSVREAARTGLLLQEAFAGALKFSRTTLELIVNDRALAPNTPETYAAALPEIETALKSLLGHSEFKITRHDQEPRQRFGVTVKAGKPFSLEKLAGADHSP